MQMNIGENVKRLRLIRGKTQAALAEAVGITPSMLAQIERGTKTLSLPLAVAIAKALHCPLGEFTGQEEEK